MQRWLYWLHHILRSCSSDENDDDTDLDSMLRMIQQAGGDDDDDDDGNGLIMKEDDDDDAGMQTRKHFRLLASKLLAKFFPSKQNAVPPTFTCWPSRLEINTLARMTPPICWLTSSTMRRATLNSPTTPEMTCSKTKETSGGSVSRRTSS